MRNYPLSSRCAETTPTMVTRQQQLPPAGHACSMDRHLSTDGNKLCPFYFWFIIMNELADIFGADSEEALLLGQLDAAAVFMEEDFDPTPATEDYA